MIPHDGRALTRRVRDAASYFKLGLAMLGECLLVHTRSKPDLGVYQLADPVPRRAPVVPFLVPVRYRGSDSLGRPKRVNLRAELCRLEARDG